MKLTSYPRRGTGRGWRGDTAGPLLARVLPLGRAPGLPPAQVPPRPQPPCPSPKAQPGSTDTPTHACPCSVPTQGHTAHEAAPPGHSPCYATLKRALLGPYSLRASQMRHIGAKLGSFWFWWSLLGFLVLLLLLLFLLSGQTQASGPSPPCPGRAPWKWQRAGISPTCTPSQDCLSNSQFQESCVFLG